MDILKFKRDQYDANNNNNNNTDSHLFLYFHKNRISIKPDIR